MSLATSRNRTFLPNLVQYIIRTEVQLSSATLRETFNAPLPHLHFHVEHRVRGGGEQCIFMSTP